MPLTLLEIAAASVGAPATDKHSLFVDTDNNVKAKDESGNVCSLNRFIGPDISPAQLVANTDDYNPTGLAYCGVLRLSTDASRDLTGIVAQAAGALRLICNVGAQNLVLKHDATSTAANRFYCPGSGDYTLHANDSVVIFYDGTSTRWRVLAA